MHVCTSIPLAAFFVASVAINSPKAGYRALELYQSNSIQAHSLTVVSDSNCTQGDSSSGGGSDDRGCGRKDR
jgi:hypothetical protein